MPDEITPEPESLFAEVPDSLATLDDAALQALIEDYQATISEVTTTPARFVTAELSAAALIEETRAAMDTLKALRAEAESRTAEPVELTDEEQAAFDEIAALETTPSGEAEGGDEAEGDAEGDEPEDEATVVAATPAPRRRARLPQPTGDHVISPVAPTGEDRIPLLAAAGAPNMVAGQEFTSEIELAQSICDRHRQFGSAGPNVEERFAIARAEWGDRYPDDRRMFGADMERNFEVVSPIIAPAAIKRALRDRIHEQAKAVGNPDAEALVASGGLCAPVTPYYNLAYISVPVRPVMGSLPSFNADRGGLRYARPAALSAVTTGVGIITEINDAAGGTFATKTCQVIPCPPFQETDVDTIYHCLQFGNLGARAFPELVAQWNNLTLAAHARLAESNLLTAIDAFSTQVTAGNLGLGATATIFSVILTAANGLRSRNRMDPEAVLRLMAPEWMIDLLISDVIRSQFERFDTDEAKVTALLRSFDIEPTFYIDGANGRAQVYGTQGNGALLPFPAHAMLYLFPEGSFIYLDSGMLELGIVRDSVLNKTNDFQLFGETFEQVAFVGVESLAIQVTACDSGTVTLPIATTCPISYVHGS